MFAISTRIITQIFHDKRSMAVMVLGPILLLTLIYFLLGKTDYKPTVALDKQSFSDIIGTKLEETLKDSKDIEFSLYTGDSDISTYVKENKIDAVITANNNKISIVMLEMVASKINIISESLKNAMPSQGISFDFDVIFGSKDETVFDSLAYYLLGVLAFFLIFLFAGISFVRERTIGTLERLMRTPIRSSAVVAGYSLGFGFFAVIQSVLVILYTKFILKAPFAGDWWLAMLIMLLIAIVAVMMGIFVSIISKSEFQVVQSIPIFIVPQIFFSGLIPVDMLPFHLNVISYILPLNYSGAALKNVMVYGYGLEKVWGYILILVGFIALLFIVNVITVIRTRRS